MQLRPEGALSGSDGFRQRSASAAIACMRGHFSDPPRCMPVADPWYLMLCLFFA